MSKLSLFAAITGLAVIGVVPTSCNNRPHLTPYEQTENECEKFLDDEISFLNNQKSDLPKDKSSVKELRSINERLKFLGGAKENLDKTMPQIMELGPNGVNAYKSSIRTQLLIIDEGIGKYGSVPDFGMDK